MFIYIKPISLNILEEFNNYVHCYCCERHQINRPDKIMPLSILKNEVTSICKNDCLCACRHNSRIICESMEKSGYFTIINTNNKVVNNKDKTYLSRSKLMNG